MQQLLYPFPDGVSPYADTLESQIRQWIYQDYDYLPEKIKKKYEHTGVGYVGARLFPNTNYAGLLSICRFSLWAFINDDAYERCTAEQLQQVRKQVIEALEGHPTKGMYAQLSLLREELLRLASPGWMQRFIASIDGYFTGMLAEIPYRSNMRYPGSGAYIAIREYAACVYPLVNLVELETGAILPDEVAIHPVIREISRLTCRIMAFCNDLYSASVEDGKDVLNLVLVMRNELQCSTEEAYSKALAIHNEDVQCFVAMRSCLPDFGCANEAVRAFVDSIGLMIQGHLQWLDYNTQRYKKNGHPGSDFKKN
ncbi:hypothetical protein SAMN05428988_4525 [Chitinophaga sp. YR573]|uniref:terpene synthase family protein n=1 Tax=Chitinophaga sp. YR573 TaxID=1881040 RepID=UPI0008C0428B|nr:hypothetical protein [Chitinophaga sp. YR573]SEW36614.1 hypothetical protein SAMN05428988_4525 [Chitinophaga sp. YR573]